ncbi:MULTISPECIES: DUF3048 domain-containing protein [Aurantimicrobium]|uniref:Lipoprotein YerB n=1 Tax=Aurantimicrobium photophilum TaxID=1987356 RepID=A0A2Z3S5F9_9MICO|nr:MULTISPECIES: DUF3048 domain-containing protein [Aurantimicrobium]AWR22018.1 Putative lipoprotein YerB precursor [Aurantimicrobium photophilum]MDF9809657.1 hypothetical protein [Aurantimicrobium minutum]MDH6207207.1 hypothetical protein [Aurantimicrobium minutum]
MTTFSRTLSRVVGVAAASALALGLAACSGGASGPATPDYKSTYKAPAPIAYAPLTGVALAEGTAVGPALSVKICNVFACEPQDGLNQADVVFEEIVEGGITRYVSIWNSNVPVSVGPVRSLRPMDADIAAPFGGIIAYSGYGAQETRDLAVDTGLVNVTENDPAMYRNDYNVAPYNLMLHAQEVIAANAGLAAPAQQWAYAGSLATSTAVLDGTPATSVQSIFSNSSDNTWTYDGAGRYLRTQWEGPDLDLTGAQLSAANVVIMRVNVDEFVGVPRTRMVDSGELFVLSGGKVVHGTWSKAATAAPIVFKGDNGVTIRLAPGNTWIEMVPLESYVTGGTVNIAG